MCQIFVGVRHYVSMTSQMGHSLLGTSWYISRTLQRRQFHLGIIWTFLRNLKVINLKQVCLMDVPAAEADLELLQHPRWNAK